jgi:uncharacterized membrane protein
MGHHLEREATKAVMVLVLAVVLAVMLAVLVLVLVLVLALVLLVLMRALVTAGLLVMAPTLPVPVRFPLRVRSSH